MKTPKLLPLSVMSAALVLSLGSLRADDPSTPPQPPPGGSDGSPGEPPPPPPGENAPPPNHRHGGRQGFSLAELTRRLTLTADQQKTIGAILADAKAKGDAVRGDESLAPADRRSQMMQINEAERASIRADLTPDQQKIFDSMRARGGWHKGPPPAPQSPTPTPAPQT